MSGFEVVGVLLGAIPLAIGGLKQLQKCAVLVENAGNCELIFARSVDYLIKCKTQYDNICTRVFQSLELPFERSVELIQNKNYAILAEPDVTEKLERSLGRQETCRKFLIFISSIKKGLEKLRKRLELDENFNVCFNLWLTPSIDAISQPVTNITQPCFIIDRTKGTVDKHQLERFFNSWRRKWKSSWRASYNEDLLAQLSADIKYLSELLDEHLPRVAHTAPIAKPGRTLMPRHWESLRSQAQGLYSRLDSCFGLCGCRKHHRLNLRLGAKGVEDETAKLTRFIFLLTMKPQSLDVSSRRQWRCVYANLCHQADVVPILGPVSQTLGSLPATLQSGTATTNLPSITIQPVAPRPRILSQPISDLCALLSEAHLAESRLGVFEFQTDNQEWKHEVWSVPRPNALEAQKLLKMDKISPKERCEVALALSSAVLQLHDTAWLPQTWSSELLSCIRACGDSTTPLTLYLSHALDAQHQAPRGQSCLIRNGAIFALGVALIELTYKVPISKLYKSEDYAAGGEITEDTMFKAAHRLAKTVEAHELPNYVKAVHRCVFCDFTSNDCNLSQQSFREKFFNEVVVPLLEDYKTLFGRSPWD